jgi:FtsP/CotA-like multicopper oxidase with cupredoxin domain
MASRRLFLKGGAGLVVGGLLAGSRAIPSFAAYPTRGLAAALPKATLPGAKKQISLAATDGWASMPTSARAIPPFWPDPAAPAPYDTYIFGFRDVTGLSAAQVAAQRGKAQICAPLLAFDEGDDVYVTLTNLGLTLRPDLVDGHTIHWHGFTNAIPLFDGVPELSISVPIGRSFTYFYRPHDPGTYMYHCHFEDVEHVQMGMTGVVFVRPKQNKGVTAKGIPAGKYVFNDGVKPSDPASTYYDREFAFILTELWAEAHYRDAHIQATDWTDYSPSFWLLNGRAYPDTLGLTTDPMTSSGRLKYQPVSSLVQAKPGEKVLLRLANLGYQHHTMTLDGIPMRVVGKDAMRLVGRDGTDLSYVTTSVEVGPGESRDVIFTAPAVGTYLLYDRAYSYLNNAGGAGYGGMRTEVRVIANLSPQTKPNQ